jgi:Predicted ABC-type transport system involved in lysophospholipase L1 biosynthesis, permease component
MKASMYFNYTSRSLIRGGQRTLLAIFCVAVGVMAIVSLQLVGLMVNNAFDSNVRDANGGDIAVTSQNQPFNSDDLQYFASLKKDGSISDYTPLINAQGSTGQNTSPTRMSFTVRVVNPAQYPLVTPPAFTDPKGGTFSSLLKNDQVVVTQSFVNQYKKGVGSTFDLNVGSLVSGSHKLNVKVAGIVDESGVLAQSGSVVLLSVHDYQAVTPKTPVTYNSVDVTAPSARIGSAAQKIQNHFPLATTQTAADALKQQQAMIDNIRKFLEIAGLLALLIGGVGIVNTMQVLLSRRKTEIAMLKTTGYRRFDLYLLFGLEAGLLGLVGGLLGALAGTGLSYVVRNVVQNSFGLNIPFLLDWFTIIGGVVIGLATALIFGLMPIIQAANIRPLNVIRDLTEGGGVVGILLTIVLMIVLSVLFCILSIFILNGDVVLGISAVYGVFVFLGILSLFFGLMIFLISKLPVPEHISIVHLTLVVVSLALSVALYTQLPAFGILLLIFSLLGLAVAFLPRSMKATTKMALRNLGRQRARTTTTMLALFVGIFTIGLIVVLGQNLRNDINNAIAMNVNFNVFAITSAQDTTKLHDDLSSIPGLSASQQHTMAPTSPVLINNKSLQEILYPGQTPALGASSVTGRPGVSGAPGAAGAKSGATGVTATPTPSSQAGQSGQGTAQKSPTTGLSLNNQLLISSLSGIEGYDVANNQLPTLKGSLSLQKGRNLNMSDAGTNNVILPARLETINGINLNLNDKIVLSSPDRKHVATVTVVGFYRQTGFGSNLYPIIGTTDATKALSSSNESVFYLKIDPNKLSAAQDSLSKLVPNAFVLSLANITDFINQLLNDILLTLTAIASLSLLAGVIIIANAVALAMLERRRELGILKSVGYTSSSILSEVLLENCIVGASSALFAMLLATLVTVLLGHLVFKANFSVSIPIALAMVGGAALLAMVTAVLVAWGAVRVRPLEVLRYE